MAAALMGEIVVSAISGEELVALGLGSCIGLALVDRRAGVAGLAHIVLPSSGSATGEAGKFADRAVVELVERMAAAGAARPRLEAVIAGGAKMFDLGPSFDVGQRNEAAVREELARVRVPVRAAQTGGHVGRTLRVSVGSCEVSVKEAGGQTITLLDGAGGIPGLPVPNQRRQRTPAQP